MAECEAIITEATIIKPTRLPAAADHDLANMTLDQPTSHFYDDGCSIQTLFMEKANPYPCVPN